MSVEKQARHRKQFESEMRDALDHITMKYGSYSNRRMHAKGLHDPANTTYLVSVDGVEHIQDGVQFSKFESCYRNVKWELCYDTIDVWIWDIFYAEGKARDYNMSLQLTMAFFDDGVKTVCKRVFHGVPGANMDENRSYTYQGYPINTGAEVISLVRLLGDMICLETLQ
jgi:hypothetical protein